jgi:nucleotide-binding universal stress UspA family protein
VEFQGKYERTSASEALDCVAVFDGTSFRLELLDAHAGLRHAPGAEREAKAAAQRDAAAAAEAAAKAKKQPRKAAARKAPPAEPQPEQVPLEGDVPGGALNEIEAAFFGGADDLD